MRSWERLGRADVPGGGVMDLLRNGKEFAIHVDGRQLMSTREYGSEEALAELGCGRIAHREEARVLIGGLGMGFTLAAALRALGPAARLRGPFIGPTTTGKVARRTIATRPTLRCSTRCSRKDG